MKHVDQEEYYGQEEVALAENNEVVISHWMNVAGLERRVVVGMMPFEDECDELAVQARLYGMSRCTGQLFWAV